MLAGLALVLRLLYMEAPCLFFRLPRTRNLRTPYCTTSPYVRTLSARPVGTTSRCRMPAWGRGLIATVALYAVGKVGEGLAPVLLARDWPACLALLVLNANDFHLVLTVRSCSGAGKTLRAPASGAHTAVLSTFSVKPRGPNSAATKPAAASACSGAT